jgi:hypothetical protein
MKARIRKKYAFSSNEIFSFSDLRSETGFNFLQGVHPVVSDCNLTHNEARRSNTGG